MTTIKYDIIILGAGCAGMQLLHQFINHEKYSGQSILLMDADKIFKQTKSWCFWHANNDHPYKGIFSKSWNSLTIGFPENNLQKNIAPYQYSFIKSEDFFDFHFKEINQHPNITYLNVGVNALKKKGNSFLVETHQSVFQTQSLYSSYWNSTEASLTASIFLKQQFYGWQIKTAKPVFNDSTATLMDFDIPQIYGVNFAYVLPFSTTDAMVEITAFSAQDYSTAFFEGVLKDYIQKNWDTSFEMFKIEHAIIPMTNYAFRRYTQEGAIAIGTAAGMVKPTTGYAFNRIFRDSVHLADAFFNKAILVEFKPSRFKFYDRLLLQLLNKKPEKALHILIQLFRKVPYPHILQFLDEDSSLLQEAKLFLQLPKKDFLVQIFNR